MIQVKWGGQGAKGQVGQEEKRPIEQYYKHFLVIFNINALFDQSLGFMVKIISLWPSFDEPIYLL